MKREEQMLQASRNYVNNVTHLSKQEMLFAFTAGVRWADEHPTNVWHPAIEEPQGDNWEVICDGSYGTLMCVPSMLTQSSWREYTRCWAVSQWAYVNDLLPKGGVK